MRIKGSRLSAQQSKKLAQFFVVGATARAAAELVGVSRHTANLFYQKLRRLILVNQEKESPFFDGEIELDESYFGGARKGKRGRGAAGKVAVFGLLKRKGKVYAQIIVDAKANTLMPIIRKQIKPDSVVYTDTFGSYKALAVSEFKHDRIHHSRLFANAKNHLNGIENFWNQAKRHLRKFNGIPKKSFPLYLKECEWRFNHPTPKQQLKLLEIWIKKHNQKDLK
jgi:transposase